MHYWPLFSVSANITVLVCHSAYWRNNSPDPSFAYLFIYSKLSYGESLRYSNISPSSPRLPMVTITVVELLIGILTRYFPTLEISSVLDHTSLSLKVLSVLPWFYIHIFLTDASCILFRPRLNPRRPSSPVPPGFLLFGRIAASAAASPFTPAPDLLRNYSTASHGSDSFLPICLSISSGGSTIV